MKTESQGWCTARYVAYTHPPTRPPVHVRALTPLWLLRWEHM